MSYKCSVLVVDDEPVILAMLTNVLAQHFAVTTVGSAEEARALLDRAHFDIVLSDQQLPGESGVSFLQWLRQHRSRTFRILMTGCAKLEDVVDAINISQVHHCVFKPWNNDQLHSTLQAVARTVFLQQSHDQLLEDLRKFNLELEERVADRTRDLEAVNEQLRRKNLMLERMALTDTLTKLPNRRAVHRIVKHELKRRVRYGGPLTLAVIDADHFKEINSRHLLIGGDHVLRWLGVTMADTLRDSDSLGRIGGEEFLVVAPETDAEGAQILAERIRAAVAGSHTIFKDETIRLTISIGVAVAEANVPADFDQMKYVAAAALAEAKLGGRNRAVLRVLPKPVDVQA